MGEDQGAEMKILLVEPAKDSLSPFEKAAKSIVDASIETLTMAEAWRMPDEEKIPVVVVGSSMPDDDQLRLCKHLADRGDQTRFVVLLQLAEPHTPHALAGIQAGADGTLMADASVDQIHSTLQMAVNLARIAQEKAELIHQVVTADRLSRVGYLAGGIAHEINNSLTYLMFNLDQLDEDLPKLIGSMRYVQAVLAERLGPHVSTEILSDIGEFFAHDFLENLTSLVKDANHGSQEIRRIVQALKTFSNLQESKFVQVRINRVIETALYLAFNEIKYRARVTKDLGETPIILASHSQITHMILNILVFSAHTIREGNANNHEIRVSTWLEENRIKIEITDTGNVLSPETAKKASYPLGHPEAFMEEEDLTLLGMAAAQAIAASLYGSISIGARAGGGGNRFTISLPAKAETPTETDHDAKPEKTPSLPSSKRLRVMIVDDERLIGLTLARSLKKEYEVEVNTSGQQAMERLEEDPNFDVIVCDLMMADVSGMDLYDWVTSHNPELAGKMIFITGGSFTPRVRDFLDSMPGRYLEKPFQIQILKQKINEMFVQNG